MQNIWKITEAQKKKEGKGAKEKKKKVAIGLTQVEKCLPSKCKALSSNQILKREKNAQTYGTQCKQFSEGIL
jgi:hypothetical protein